MQKFGKDVYGGQYVHVSVVEFDEKLNVHNIAFPNIHHVIYRKEVAREALCDKSMKRVNDLLIQPRSDIADLFISFFTATRSILIVENT